eukprot:2324642-Rhodomonas_salina.1
MDSDCDLDLVDGLRTRVVVDDFLVSSFNGIRQKVEIGARGAERMERKRIGEMSRGGEGGEGGETRREGGEREIEVEIVDGSNAVVSSAKRCGFVCPIVLRACYAMSGTDTVYDVGGSA